MNRIKTLFNNKQEKILSVYMTAGFPLLNDTVSIIQILEKYKVDMIEIGIPFSDPVADGPVIQNSNSCALANGMSLKLLFSQLENIRTSVKIPLLLMGYINPVLRMGIENFLLRCEQTGIDGVIIPDLPPEEFEKNYRKMFIESGVYNICLISPQTPQDRIRYIDELSEGFIYMVASASTTGVREVFNSRQTDYFRSIKEMKLRNHCLAGFGISNRETFNMACEYVKGAIIGSAFIKAINEPGDMDEKICKFTASIL